MSNWVDVLSGTLRLVNSGALTEVNWAGVVVVGADRVIPNRARAGIARAGQNATVVRKGLHLMNDGVTLTTATNAAVGCAGIGLDIAIRNGGLMSGRVGNALGLVPLAGTVGTRQLSNTGTIEGDITGGSWILSPPPVGFWPRRSILARATT